jgi:hypothetical protein
MAVINDYVVKLYHDGNVEASFRISNCPSEVVALSKVLNIMFNEFSISTWVKCRERTIQISFYSEGSNEDLSVIE